MTCRDEILVCAKFVMGQTGLDYFTVQEIIDCMAQCGSAYKESTIRTHITSRMCVNAPDHHAVKYKDVKRSNRGTYQLLGYEKSQHQPQISSGSDIEGVISSFHRQLSIDQHHRYKSWEYCYSYFSKDDIDVDHACLHLALYLASWGMYRGSSFLLWKDYLIHEAIVRELISKRHLRSVDFTYQPEETISEIFNLSNWIKDWYTENITSVNGHTKRIIPTNTLVTKILLGTLGCIPAYDRYFVGGLRKKGIGFSTLTKGNLLAVLRFYQSNKTAFDNAQKHIMDISGVHYPAMKLVDMYFWQIGFEAASFEAEAIV